MKPIYPIISENTFLYTRVNICNSRIWAPLFQENRYMKSMTNATIYGVQSDNYWSIGLCLTGAFDQERLWITLNQEEPLLFAPCIWKVKIYTLQKRGYLQNRNRSSLSISVGRVLTLDMPHRIAFNNRISSASNKNISNYWGQLTNASTNRLSY